MREKSKREVSRDVLSFSLINVAGVIIKRERQG
jgi:hypothetical protein